MPAKITREEWEALYGNPDDLCRLFLSAQEADLARLTKATPQVARKAAEAVAAFREALTKALESPLHGDREATFGDLLRRVESDDAPIEILSRGVALRLADDLRELAAMAASYEDNFRAVAPNDGECSSPGRAADPGFPFAAWFAAQLIPDRSPNAEVVWDHVRFCLEYHGHQVHSTEAIRKASPHRADPSRP